MPDHKELRGSLRAAAQQLEWRAIEAEGHAHFIRKGWRVLISPYDIACYDFVAEKDGMFLRVNVKTATWHGATYSISRSGRAAHRIDPDLYLVWLPKERAFVEAPGPMLKGKSARLPRRFVADQLEGSH